MKKFLLSVFCLFSFMSFATAEEAPVFSVEPGTYNNPFSVEITAKEGATIYYTLDGTEPTEESAKYNEAIAFNEFNKTTTIKAISRLNGEWSDIATASYSLEVAAPVFSTKGGVYTKLSLKFTCETNGATILYNNRGGDPTKEGSKSYGSLSVLATAEIKAVAYIEVDGKKIYSNIASEKYYISPVKPYEKAAEFVAGKYLIHANGCAATAMGETVNYGFIPQFAVTANGNYIETNAFHAFTFTEVEGGYTIQDTFGRYMYQTEDNNSFNAATDMPKSGAVWTVTIDETTGEATITNAAMNKYIQYSAQDNSFGSYAQDNGHMPTLYKLGEYPSLTVTPAHNDTIPVFDKVRITCESGIKYNENDENYPYYTINWDYTPKEFDNAVVVNENTIELTFKKAITKSGDYRVTLPAGLFILNPNGLAKASEKAQYTYTVENTNILEVIYAVPDRGEQVESIEYLYFEYNQKIAKQTAGAVIKNEKGEEFPLTSTNTDQYGTIGDNALCLKTDKPITAPGIYTFVLKKEYAYGEESNAMLTADITYTFTIVEGLKITNISPVAGTEIAAINEFIIEFNQSATCYAEGFPVYDENGTEYAFMISHEDKDGKELPDNMLRAYSDTPITAAGTYTMFIFDVYAQGNSNSISETYIFTFDGSKITTDIDNVKNENGEVKAIYDLTGRKVENITAPGIYIVGGRKVLVK